MRQTQTFLLLLGLLCTAGCSAQTSSPFAPEAGSYSGASTGVTATYQYGYNGVTGFGMQPSSQINVMPSPLGELIIRQTGSNKGTYLFSNAKDWTGNWQYHAETNSLTFTGPLKDKVAGYHAAKGFYSIRLRLGATASDKEGIVYTYSKKASKPLPKPANPNAGITGRFTLMPDASTVAIYHASGKTESSFSGNMASSNKNHYTLTVGYTNDPHFYELKIVDGAGRAVIHSPEKIKGWNMGFLDYKFGVLSDDNTTVALLGKTPDNYANLTYTPGEYVVAVIDTRTGAVKSFLPMYSSSWIKPAFLPGGGLVYCPKEGGIAVTDAAYKNKRLVYANPVNALAVSPDGKKIAFSEGLFFYTMNIDGSGKKQIICNNEPLQVTKGEEVTDIGWSPDGRHLAFAYGPSMAYNLVIVPLDGGNYRYLNDDDGEPIRQHNPIVSWH